MPGPFDLEERLARFFQSSLHLDIPSADTDLFETGVLDSLAFVELVLLLEREFGVRTTVDDLDVDHFRTITHIARFVAARAPMTGRVVLMRARA